MSKKKKNKIKHIFVKEQEALKFLFKFNLFAIPLYILLLLKVDFIEVQRFVAYIVLNMLNFSGILATMNNLLITIPIENGSWAGFINSDCIGWKSIMVYVALVLATNFSMKKKAIGLTFIPLIFVINILRIFFMFFYVSTFGLILYPLVHGIIWSFGLLFVVLIIWFFWAKYVPENKYIQRRGNYSLWSKTG